MNNVRVVKHPGIQFVLVDGVCERIDVLCDKPRVTPARTRGFKVSGTINHWICQHTSSSQFVEEAWVGWVIRYLYFPPPFEDTKSRAQWYANHVHRLLKQLKNKPKIHYAGE